MNFAIVNTRQWLSAADLPDDSAQGLSLQAKGETDRVDLSQVTGKYIGETEKHLDAVLGLAEIHGGALLFDEADALFGKRSDVPTSDRRYPGVYVTEVPFDAKPIEGVPTSTAPEWTDFNQHDPGVTLLQLLAWASESLLYQTHTGRGVVGGLAVDAHGAGGSPQVTASAGLAVGADGRRIDPNPTADVSKARIFRLG